MTGDDANIKSILQALGSVDLLTDGSQPANGSLLSSVDHGRPAQAVSNWVQCENPDCLKWRKVPWYVDIDTLSDKFYCKDNKWNPAYASCEAPEDEWDETADAQVEADGSAYCIESIEPHAQASKPEESSNHACKIADFKLGGKVVRMAFTRLNIFPRFHTFCFK